MGLIAHFPLNGNLNNYASDIVLTSGSSAYDTNSKTASYSLSFSGNYMYFKNPFIGLDEWTLACWYKANSPAAWSDIFTFTKSYGRIEFTTANNGANLNWYQNTTDYGDLITSGTSIVTGLSDRTWYHITLTYNHGTTTIYLNGVQKVQQTGKSNYASASDRIYFANRADLNAYANINVNDIRCYDHCLSTSEINELNKCLVLSYDFGSCNINKCVNSKDNYSYSGFNQASASIGGSAGFTYNIFKYDNCVVNRFSPGNPESSNYPGACGPYTNTSSRMGATLIVGKTYTISVYIKADINCSLSLGGLSEGQTRLATSDSTVTQDWKRFWVTFTATSTSFNSCLYCLASSNTSGSYVYYYGWKIENGDKLTAYTNQSSLSITSSTGVCDGTNYSCETIGDSKSGDVSLLTGASGYVTVPSIYLDTKFTISTWVKFNTINGWARLFDFGNATQGGDYAIGIATSGAYGELTVFGRTGAGAGLPDTYITSVSANTWYHIVLTIDNTNLKVYINNVLMSNFTTANRVGNVNYTLNYIGKSNWSADPYSDKVIDAFQIYNSCLSADDVNVLYKQRMHLNRSNECNLREIKETSNSFSLSKEGTVTSYNITEGNYPTRYVRITMDGSNENSGNHIDYLGIVDICGNDICIVDATDGLRVPSVIQGSCTLGNSSATNPWVDVATVTTFDAGKIINASFIHLTRYWFDARHYYKTKIEISKDNSTWVTIYDSKNTGYYGNDDLTNTYTEISRGYYFQCPSSPLSVNTLLPKEYQEIEYLRSFNSACIVTDLNPNPHDDFEFILKFNEPKSDSKIFGVYSPDGWALGILNGKFRNFVTWAETDLAVQCGILHIKTRDNGSTLLVDDQSTSYPRVTAHNDKYRLFVSHYYPTNEIGGAGDINLYRAKIYRHKGVVADFIPCYRKSDYMAGMYDIISRKFYPNSNSSGYFEKGPNFVHSYITSQEFKEN